MSDSPLDHPEIKALLQEADAMTRVLQDLGEDEAGNFAAALEQIYADLGRAIHKLLPSESAFDDDETTAVTGRLAEAMADLAQAPKRRSNEVHAIPLLPEDEEEPTDPGIDKPDPPDSPTPTSLADRARRAKTPVPKPKTPTRREARMKRAEERHAAVVATLEREGTPSGAEARAVAPGTNDGSFGRAAVHIQRDVGPTDWIERLADLLELIALPNDLTAAPDLAAEASLVQWSTSDLDTTWAPFPPAIKAALLGLLASRARHLQDRLSVDVGPRIALERLSSYRERAGLAKVEGLYPERKAQSGTWQADAARWWETLVEGLREA